MLQISMNIFAFRILSDITAFVYHRPIYPPGYVRYLKYQMTQIIVLLGPVSHLVNFRLNKNQTITIIQERIYILNEARAFWTG